jgi:hypothetical protein
MTDSALEIRRKITILQVCLKKLPQVEQQVHNDPQGDPQDVADGWMLSNL